MYIIISSDGNPVARRQKVTNAEWPKVRPYHTKEHSGSATFNYHDTYEIQHDDHLHLGTYPSGFLGSSSFGMPGCSEAQLIIPRYTELFLMSRALSIFSHKRGSMLAGKVIMAPTPFLETLGFDKN